ncbi:MAG: hypothetical protein J6W16_04135 [Methanobrevibacter sp.]|nr:hypothetical protein [Methanobrevibacter sp.]
MNSPICYKVIYTKSLDNASDVIAESWEYTDKNDAIKLFNDKVNQFVKEILKNQFLKFNCSIVGYKAMIKIESTHHCIAIVDDMNKSIL